MHGSSLLRCAYVDVYVHLVLTNQNLFSGKYIVCALACARPSARHYHIRVALQPAGTSADVQ